jgi:hypothetical protein
MEFDKIFRTSIQTMDYIDEPVHNTCLNRGMLQYHIVVEKPFEVKLHNYKA